MYDLKIISRFKNNLKAGFILFLLASVNCFAQSMEPIFPQPNIIPLGNSYNPQNPFPDQWNYFPQLKKDPLQTVTNQQQQLAQQQNRQQMQSFRNPPPPTPAEITQAQ